jgi:DNA-binding NarL/FixJ family response regulator
VVNGAGKSNRHIADQLTGSERTAPQPGQHILTKLRVSSRTQTALPASQRADAGFVAPARQMT